MSFELRPGSALGCNVNSHRSGWDGTVCRGASSWDCGAATDFREDYCEHGRENCFHLHNFDADGPRMRIHSSGGNWIFESSPEALDDQILLLWGRDFREPRGIMSGQPREFHVFGAYRVKEVRALELSHRTDWEIVPYPDGWVRFERLKLSTPRWKAMSGKHFKEVEGAAVLRLFAEGRDKLRSYGSSWSQEERERFETFQRALPGWLETAKVKAAALTKKAVALSTPKPRSAPAALKPRVSSGLLRPKGVGKTDFATTWIHPSRRASLAERFGTETLRALLVGTLSKPLLILRGAPGVGKSYTALNLLEEGSEMRTLVVPVGSTWRGREDLLGHVNPIDNQFEPTSFTNFMIRAAQAWERGERDTWLVVFEEFNLSQPEHWLSDVLVRSQYPPTPTADRTIVLGGEKLREGGASRLYLSPCVKFVGTINNDHTTRALSPRVLDRAAVVELSLEPAACLEQAGVSLAPEQVEAISELDYRVQELGAGFSIRTAQSVARAQRSLQQLELDSWDALDLVLAQEVLSKIQLLAMDTSSQHALTQLLEWSEGAGAKLAVCGRLISSWRDTLELGRDVQQA